MSNLEPYKQLYRRNGKETSDEEAREAQFNLVGFFKELIKVDRELKEKKDADL